MSAGAPATHTSALAVAHVIMCLQQKRTELWGCDDLVQRALAVVKRAEAAAGILALTARMAQLLRDVDKLCRKRETCLQRVEARARKRAKLAMCNPGAPGGSAARVRASRHAVPAFEHRFTAGIEPLHEEYTMLRTHELYLREHCANVKKAHGALLWARRALHAAQQALAEALRC